MLHKNIIFNSKQLLEFYSCNRQKWEEFYPSEKWVFEKIAKDNKIFGDVLDVGCACGGLGVALSNRFILNSYTGVDIHKDVIGWAKGEQKLTITANFICGDVVNLDINRQYDTVVSLSCADFNIETNTIIKKCWSFVKPGGYFIASLRLTDKKGINNIQRSLLERILNEAYDLGVRSVGFYTTGEPFVSNKLAESVAMAKRIGFYYVYITTNGVLATPDRMRTVVEAGLDSVKFSINAGTPDTYRRIHGVDAFDKVLNNLKFIVEYRKKIGRPFKIYVSYVVIRQNQEEWEMLKHLVAPFADYVLFFAVYNQGGMIGEIDQLSPAEELKNKFPCTKKAPCSMVFNRLHITCKGYLTICCVDYQNYLVVADLHKSCLKEAWCSDMFVEIRRRHLQDMLKGTQCYNCIYDKHEKTRPLMPEYATIYKPNTYLACMKKSK
ncbi:MAG: radical SAM protein [Candidatus Omnitrophota bacterium]|nr:radical SAM protein [Candidatus Omnitrophota bacterium]